jgi:tetratricopeptide (TPR) repeat protein
VVQQPAAPADPRFPLFHGVPAQPTNFVGREEILDRLVARLTAGGNASVSAGGTGGAGKTTLAVKLAYDARILAHFTEGVLWAALGKDPAIEAILGEWAEALGLDVSSLAEPAQRAQAIKNAVGLRSILFIIDDVWDEAAASLLRCGGPNCAHLLTTRDDAIARGFAGPAATEKIPELEPAPAFELLKALAPEVCAAEPKAARALVKDVGGLPLAIELLGGYLGDPARTGLAGLRAEALREMSNPARRLQLAQERLGGRPGERPTLEQAIALSLDDLPEEVVHAFYCLGAFSPKPDTFDPVSGQFVANADPSCFGLLLRRRLIEMAEDEHTKGERLSIHPVIVEHARSRMPTDAKARHRAAYEALLDSTRDDWRSIEREYPQIRHAWSQLDEGALDKVAFVYRVQDYQRLRGLWSDRIEWVEQALELAVREEKKEHVARLLSQLGSAYNAFGQRQKALEYHERALPITEEVGHRKGTAVTLNNIGIVYAALGQRHKALEYYERVLPIMEEVGDQKEIAATLANIGKCYDAWGQWQKALEYYERALPITREVGDRQGLAFTLNYIGNVYHAQKEWQKALEYYERALPIMEEVGDQEGLSATINNIASFYHDQGQRQQALEYYERALLISEEIDSRQGTAIILNNIGNFYKAQKQWRKALEYYERTLPIREEVGDRHGLATTLNNIGSVYGAQGQRQRALEYHERALAIMEEVGDQAGEAVTRFNIGEIYRRDGRLAEAVEQFRRCVELDEAVQHPDLESDRAVLREVEAELAVQVAAATAEPAPPSLLDRAKRLFRRKE